MLVLILLGSVSYFPSSKSPTGAIAGDGSTYEKCLGHGKDKTGKWHWDWIKECRDYVEGQEKGVGKAIPRLWTSQNAYDEFIEKYGTVDEDRP